MHASERIQLAAAALASSAVLRSARPGHGHLYDIEKVGPVKCSKAVNAGVLLWQLPNMQPWHFRQPYACAEGHISTLAALCQLI
jgi:hypothetical protein